MEFFRPGKYFPAVSVSGSKCELNCPHCQGKYLGNMIAAESPEEMMDLAMKMEDDGYMGFLLSGGCDSTGKIPLDGFFEALRSVKKNTDLMVNLHTGWIDEGSARDIADIGIDVVSYDVIGSADTIKKVYGVNITPEDIMLGFHELKSLGVKVVPHITTGLDEGILKGEFKAIDLVCDTERLIINSLIPSDGFGQRVSDQDILSVFGYAREKIDGKIIMGCMRERGRYPLEIDVLKLGIDGIVLPSKKTVEWCKSRYEITWLPGCCAIHT